MQHTSPGSLRYRLANFELNELLGRENSLRATGKINCIHCDRVIKKTFNQGYCFPCSQKLAACDLCILKPELCHFRFGTCREPEWAKQNCLQDHVVYLANTAGLKVGITRGFKKFERWGDQGATEAIEIARVPERYIAGLMEVALVEHLADKADWRKLLRGEELSLDLVAERNKIPAIIKPEFEQFLVSDAEPVRLSYPVLRYPAKAVSLNFDKQPEISGELLGIRGQYLLFPQGGLNMRKFGGYEIEFKT